MIGSFMTVIAYLEIKWWDIKHGIISIILYPLNLSTVAKAM